MNDGTRDQVSVTFPASPEFSRIGRVAIAGVALRLGVEIAVVERLRAAVDNAVDAMAGAGRIHLDARWEPDRLLITVDNPDRGLTDDDADAIRTTLASLADDVRVDHAGVSLMFVAAPASSVSAAAESQA
ncbi:MAG: hypothetical protein AAF467_05240 [Actinomycetota bacterium]